MSSSIVQDQGELLSPSSEQTRTTTTKSSFLLTNHQRTPAEIIREYDLFKSIAEQVIELSLGGNETCRDIYRTARKSSSSEWLP